MNSIPASAPRFSGVIIQASNNLSECSEDSKTLKFNRVPDHCVQGVQYKDQTVSSLKADELTNENIDFHRFDNKRPGLIDDLKLIIKDSSMSPVEKAYAIVIINKCPQPQSSMFKSSDGIQENNSPREKTFFVKQFSFKA